MKRSILTLFVIYFILSFSSCTCTNHTSPEPIVDPEPNATEQATPPPVWTQVGTYVSTGAARWCRMAVTALISISLTLTKRTAMLPQ